MNTKPWQPIQVGDIKLNHRIAMALMIRGRAAAHGVPPDLNAEYYAEQDSPFDVLPGTKGYTDYSTLARTEHP